MLQSLIEFIRTLTNPEKLIELLSTILSGWLGYAALSGIIFSETGLLLDATPWAAFPFAEGETLHYKPASAVPAAAPAPAKA